MRNNIRYAFAAVAIGLASAATAQNLQSGYFTEGYLYRHDLNPALGNDQGYVSMPGLGNLNVGITGNMRTDNFLYNVNGKTSLFLNPNVSTSEFLSNIKDKNKLSENLRLQIFGTGFKAFGGYNTIEINARQSMDLVLPGDIFRLAKEGVENKTYDMGGLEANAMGYAEFALGHSHKINDHLRVGAKVKFLFGIANIDAKVNKAQLTLAEDEWRGVTNAEINASIKEMTYKVEEKERGPEGDKTLHRYVSGIDDSSWGLNGFGMAMDLGAVYKLDDNWSFSASLLDLGFIGWKTNYTASTNGDRTINSDRYHFNVDDDASNSFDNEVDRLTEGLASLYELQDNGDQGSRSKSLKATMNLGVEYTPDFYDKLKFGFMNSTRMAGAYSYTDFRLSANVAPCKIFSASTNVALGTYGSSFGWLINFHPNGFNLYMGMDHTLGKIAKQGVPLSGKANVNIGINFPFGK